MRYQAMKLPSHPASLWADALALALAVSLPLFMPNGYVALIGENSACCWPAPWWALRRCWSACWRCAPAGA